MDLFSLQAITDASQLNFRKSRAVSVPDEQGTNSACTSLLLCKPVSSSDHCKSVTNAAACGWRLRKHAHSDTCFKLPRGCKPSFVSTFKKCFIIVIRMCISGDEVEFSKSYIQYTPIPCTDSFKWECPLGYGFVLRLIHARIEEEGYGLC